MKIKLLGLIGLLLLSTNSFAAEKNDCDRMIEDGFPMSAVKLCWDREGKSEYYLQRQAAERQNYEQDQAEAARQEAQRVAEARRVANLKKAIVKKTFSFLDLKKEFYGMPVVAVKRTFKYKSGNFDKTVDKTLTKGADICKYLGFDKATNVEINSKEVDSFDVKGFYVEKKTPLFSNSSYKKEVFKEKHEDVVALYLRSVTCVRSKVANNELLESMEEAVRFLEADINTGAPIIRTNVAVNNSSRDHEDDDDDYDDEDDDNSDGGPFTHSSGSGQ